MKRLLFVFSFLLFTSLLFTGKAEAQKVSAGLYFNPQAVTYLQGEEVGIFEGNSSLWGVIEMEFGRFTISPLYDFSTNAVGLFTEVSFREEKNFGLYLLGEKNIYDDENYLGLGIDFYISKEDKKANSLNDSSIFFELGSPVSYWELSFSVGATIPIVFTLKDNGTKGNGITPVAFNKKE